MTPDTRRWAGVVMASLLLALGSRVGAESSQTATISETPDWPVLISRLQQEMYERPGHTQTREQLAIAYNNYGVTLGDHEQWELAERQLQEALRLDGTNAQFQHNLAKIRVNEGTAAYKRHDLTGAMSAVDNALAVEPDLAAAYALRGNIEYDRQRLKEAKIAWERALQLDPSQPELAQRLERLAQELPVESGYERLSQASFDLRYEERLSEPAGFDIRDALLEARRGVGSDFAYWPKHKLVVVVYSAESFRKVREENPEWIAGQFDGKIRIRFPKNESDFADVKEILFHEYTHALIQDLAQGLCPTWLNEGLAVYEGRTQLARPLDRLQGAFKKQQLIPWATLSDAFSVSHPAEEVALAYEQSYSIAAYLITRYGFWRIRRVLKAIGDGRPWEDVLKDETRLSLPRLETAWRASLPELLGGG